MTSINALQKIMTLNNPTWQILAYVLNQDKTDELRAMVFPLGSFKTEEAAEAQVKKLMEQTGYSRFVVARYGQPVPITNQADSINVPVDLKGKVLQMEKEDYAVQRRLWEERIQREQELLKEAEEECDVNHIEHYKRVAYLATTHYLNILHLTKQLEEKKKLFNQRKQDLLQHLSHHPEHETMFLPYFKEKLLKRGEEDLYLKIEAGYQQVKELL